MEIEWMTNFYSLIRFQMKSIRYDFEKKKKKKRLKVLFIFSTSSIHLADFMVFFPI